MRLMSARQAWHDCFYQGGRCALETFVERACWGQVQLSEVARSLHIIGHQALAGWLQAAIASLPWMLQSFGRYLHAPEVSTLQSNAWAEVAHELVWSSWEGRHRLGEEKAHAARWVVAGVLYRYRVRGQGRMGGPDPLESPRHFRAWLQDRHSVYLDRRNWAREWVGSRRGCSRCATSWSGRRCGCLQWY